MAFFVFRSENRIEIKGWQQKIINLRYTPKFRYYLFHHKTKTNCPQKPIFAQNGENIVRLYVCNLQINQMMAKKYNQFTIYPKFSYNFFHHKTKILCPKKPIFAQNGGNIVKFHMFNLQVDQISSFYFMGKTIFLLKRAFLLAQNKDILVTSAPF